MAKKSNKTEHVLKLITKNEDAMQDDFFGITPIPGNQVTEVPPKAAAEPKPKKTAGSKKQEEISAPKPVEVSGPQSAEAPDSKPDTVAAADSHKTKPQEEKASNEDPVLQNAESAFIAQHDNLVNIAEILVKEKLSLVMSRMKVCTCSTCVNDVLALALNTLPTKYVTTDAGKQFFQLDIYKKQYETDVLAALTKACVRVKASPRHEMQMR